MSATEQLRDFVNKTQHAPHSHVEGTDWFKRLDLDKITRDLNLEDVGAERGTREEPPSEATEFDDVEERILDYVRDRRSEADQEYASQRDTYLQRLSRNGILTIVSDIDEAAKLGSTKIDTAVAEAQGALPPLADKVSRARSDYDAFRLEHGLTREADYPESGGKLLKYLIVAGLLVIETAANGFFFARGNTLGLVGGWSEAIMFAAANIFLALAAGSTIGRWVHHRQPGVRRVGYGGLAVWVLVAVLLAIFVGHYRDALEAGAADAFATAKASAMSGLLAFHSIHSWILFGAGLFFAAVAAHEGRTLDDVYPGYGEAARKKERSEHDYELERRDYLESIQEAYEEALESMRRKATDSVKRMADNERIFVDLKLLGNSYGQHLTYLESVGNNLLQIYREANRRARQSKAPPSFRKKWREFHEPILESAPAEYSKEGMSKILQEAERRRTEGLKRLDKNRAIATGKLQPISGALNG